MVRRSPPDLAPPASEREDHPVPDIVAIITSQHRTVDRLLEQAQEEGADTLALLRQLSELLLPHSRAEESFVYPAIRERQGDEAEQVHDSVAEHHDVERMLEDLLAGDPDAPGYDGRVAALAGALRHHVEEEEQELLPVLQKKASDEERAEMGARFARETGAGDEATGGGSDEDLTRDELYEKAREQDVAGRSSMTKDELRDAVQPD
jgi:hemerythrin superfamily protein